MDIVEGLQEHFLPICVAECHTQASSSLPQLNARQGILEAADELRCSCCAGEFVFSYVALVKRKGESLCSLPTFLRMDTRFTVSRVCLATWTCKGIL